MTITKGPLRAAPSFVLLSIIGLTQTPTVLVAQAEIDRSRSILQLLPLQVSALGVGGEVVGTLSETDYR